MLKKECRRCEKVKSVDLFHKKPGGALGYDSICKKCIATSRKLHRKELRELKKAQREKRFDRSKIWQLRNLQVQTVDHPVSDEGIVQAVTLLTDSINNNHLMCWEDELWEREPATEECFEEFPMGA